MSDPVIQEGTDVFISYSRKDREYVHWLNDRLREAGREPWIDWAAIQPSEEWWSAIQLAIDAANTFAFVLSPDSIVSDICRKEIDRAVSSGKRIVPIVCRDIEGLAVHPEIYRLNYIFLLRESGWEEGLAKLFQALDTDLAHVRSHTRFLVRAREWEAAGRLPGKLLRGADLADAEVWISSVGGKLPATTALQADHLNASQAEARAQRDKQRRLIGRAFVKPAYQAIEDGHYDHALRLAAAGAVLAEDLDRAVVPEWWGPAARAMLANRTLAVMTGHSDVITVVDISRTGTQVLTASLDGTARVWEAASGREVSRMGQGDKVWSASWNSDGIRVVTASEDGTAPREGRNSPAWATDRRYSARPGARMGPAWSPLRKTTTRRESGMPQAGGKSPA